MDLRTGCAYWLIKNGLLATDPRLTRDETADVAAASTGLLLYETDTSLSELAGLGGLGAGVRSYQIGRDAIDRIEELCETVGDPCGFARRPSPEGGACVQLGWCVF